ncbi:transcription factor mef2A-like [Zophobas morio]|uniref:transcription factor mef2A-like n=1 Tax=Zophobas morio TaxID=2755281 RepID=UPI00308383A7
MKETKVSFYSNENDACPQAGEPTAHLSFKDGFMGEKNVLLTSSGPFQRESDLHGNVTLLLSNTNMAASKNEIRVNLDNNTSTTNRNFKNSFYDDSNRNSIEPGSQYHNTNELVKRSILKILQGRSNKNWKDGLKFISQTPAIQTEKERCEFPGCTKVYSSKHSCRRHFRTKHAKGRTLDDLLPAEGSDQQIQNSSEKLPIPHSGSKDFSVLDSIGLRPQLQKRVESLEPTKRHSIDTMPSDLHNFREELLYKIGRQHNNVNKELNASNNLNQNVNFVKNKRNSLGSLLEGSGQNLLLESRSIPGLNLNTDRSNGSNAKSIMQGPYQQLQSQTSQVPGLGNLPTSSHPLIINSSDNCGIFKPTQTLRRRPLSLTEAYQTESSPVFLHPEDGISLTDLCPSMLPPDFYNNFNLLSKRNGNSPTGRPGYNLAINGSYNVDLNIYNKNDNKNDRRYNAISGNYNSSAGLVFADFCNIKKGNSERGDSNNKGAVLNLIGNISSYEINGINTSDYKNKKDLTFGTSNCTYDNSQINNDYNRNCENELAYVQSLNTSVDECNKAFTEFKLENLDKNRNLVHEDDKYIDWGNLSSTLMAPSLEFSNGLTNPFNTQLLGQSANLGSRAIFPFLEGNRQFLNIDGYFPPSFKQVYTNQNSVTFGRPLDQSLQPYNL